MPRGGARTHAHYRQEQIAWFCQNYWQFKKDDLIFRYQQHFNDTSFGKSQYNWLKQKYGCATEWGAVVSHPPAQDAKPGGAGTHGYVPNTFPAGNLPTVQVRADYDGGDDLITGPQLAQQQLAQHQQQQHQQQQQQQQQQYQQQQHLPIRGGVRSATVAPGECHAPYPLGYPRPVASPALSIGSLGLTPRALDFLDNVGLGRMQTSILGGGFQTGGGSSSSSTNNGRLSNVLAGQGMPPPPTTATSLDRSGPGGSLIIGAADMPPSHPGAAAGIHGHFYGPAAMSGAAGTANLVGGGGSGVGGGGGFGNHPLLALQPGQKRPAAHPLSPVRPAKQGGERTGSSLAPTMQQLASPGQGTPSWPSSSLLPTGNRAAFPSAASAAAPVVPGTHASSPYQLPSFSYDAAGRILFHNPGSPGAPTFDESARALPHTAAAAAAGGSTIVTPIDPALLAPPPPPPPPPQLTRQPTAPPEEQHHQVRPVDGARPSPMTPRTTARTVAHMGFSPSAADGADGDGVWFSGAHRGCVLRGGHRHDFDGSGVYFRSVQAAVDAVIGNVPGDGGGEDRIPGQTVPPPPPPAVDFLAEGVPAAPAPMGGGGGMDVAAGAGTEGSWGVGGGSGIGGWGGGTAERAAAPPEDAADIDRWFDFDSAAAAAVVVKQEGDDEGGKADDAQNAQVTREAETGE